MAFMVTVIKLEEAMKKKGCPVCRLEVQAAERWLELLLWENTNDSKTRTDINAAQGFCPPHTRQLAALEQGREGSLLGVNIIYENLAKQTARDLRSYRPGRLRLAWRPGKSGGSVLPARGVCPACAAVEANTINCLAALFQSVQAEDADLIAAYAKSDGLCLRHLKRGLGAFGAEHPRAARHLADQAAERLEALRGQMREYIRKQNWEYRGEALSPAEAEAWEQALTFFTGLPGGKFTHKYEGF